ncbi:dihydrolipoyl dehydrogenase [Schaalia cardiffensis F0333]|uniref:Dihydrolipoyl dehydrogenase n=1 Tax=Schaalia cardiffensis F0333 TaxID=888050 RepID=N6X278_9ACTO|nr:dihydrolipoyl dehydrogenase [Schaalia cardiffensis F0333]
MIQGEVFVTEAEYDIVILGAGSGGYATALRAAQLGMKVALVEGDKVGGTCLHRGCIPTKAYLHAAETADTVRESEAFGILSSFQGIDMAKVGAYRDSVITKLYKGLQGLLSSRKVEIVSGWGRLVSENSVEVNGRVLTGRNIVLATGSYSRSLPGLEIGGRVISSDQALQMDWVPRSAVILGGGVIGLEFASVWRSFGAEVTIIEALPHLANNEDEAVSKQLERAYRKRGIAFHTNTRFSGATQDENGVHVSTETGKTFDADILLVAVGRGPVTQGLGYEEAGIRMDRGFVLVDERLRTGVGSIRAVGDIVPGLQLAHRGFLQGIFVAEDIAGLNPAVIDESGIPRVTFCEPEIASVGLTERAAREKYGDAVRTVEYNLAGNGKSNILGTAGFIKLVSVENGPIVGFHGIGSRIGEQIGEGELMVNWEAYPSDVASLIHAHPSQNESIGEAAMALAGKPLHAHN